MKGILVCVRRKVDIVDRELRQARPGRYDARHEPTPSSPAPPESRSGAIPHFFFCLSFLFLRCGRGREALPLHRKLSARALDFLQAYACRLRMRCALRGCIQAFCLLIYICSRISICCCRVECRLHIFTHQPESNALRSWPPQYFRDVWSFRVLQQGRPRASLASFCLLTVS